jgi:hypothetical protein
VALPIGVHQRRCPDSLTERVIGAILEVSNILGAGFLEKVYERALLRELGPTRQPGYRMERRCNIVDGEDLNMARDLLARRMGCSGTVAVSGKPATPGDTAEVLNQQVRSLRCQSKP